MPLRLNFDLTAIRTEDRKGDEPRVQIAFVTLFDRRVQVIVQDTGRLAEDFPGRRNFAAGTRTLTNIRLGSAAMPNATVPYLGIVARLIDDDKSDASHRSADKDRFSREILISASRALAEDRLPTVDDLWVAGNSAPLIDRGTNDPDDNLGVSARVFKEAGHEIDGDIASFSKKLEFLFNRDGARYEFDGVLTAEPD